MKYLIFMIILLKICSCKKEETVQFPSEFFGTWSDEKHTANSYYYFEKNKLYVNAGRVRTHKLISFSQETYVFPKEFNFLMSKRNTKYSLKLYLINDSSFVLSINNPNYIYSKK